jgi:hypothetical protein
MNVSLDKGRWTKIDSACGPDISGKVAQDDDVARMNIGFYARVGTNGKTAIREVNGSFNVSIDVKVFITGEFSANDDRLTDDSGTFCWLHSFFYSPLGAIELLMGLARTIPKLMP